MDLFGAGERVTAEVLTWEHVSLGQHRGGGTEFRLGRRVFGQLHANSMVDILLPKAMRVELVLSGAAEPHPILPTSGWVTVYLYQPRDEIRALKILRTAYQLAGSLRSHSCPR